MIRGVHHLGVNCRDFDRMLKFYREGLGFEFATDEFNWEDQPIIDAVIDVPGSAARSVMLRSGSCYLELFRYSAPEPRVTEPLRPQDKGYTHLCIEVTDLDRDMEHLKAAGMTFNGREPYHFDENSGLYGYDPEGNIIEVLWLQPHSTQSLTTIFAMRDAAKAG